MDKENIIRRVFDTTPEGLLHSTTASNGAYILLPASGNYSQMQAACKNIFQ
jgi:hypothetical protein